MTSGKAISLFLIDGTPDGRVMCELFNWTGKGYKIPRSLLKESANRDELYKAGVYFLFGREETSTEFNLVYIGEAEEVYKRIVQHQEKDFWTEVLIFVSKDENLNKAHIKFLEFKIYEAATQAKRYKTLNGIVPTCPAISEPEQAVILEFFSNLKLLVGTFGYKIFEPLNRPVISADEYFLAGPRGANARGIITSEGFVVTEGSEIAHGTVPSTPEPILKLRQELQEQDTVVNKDGKLAFASDYLFSSPSTAAAVVLGRSANGRVEWKDKKNRTLKENEEE